MRVLWVFDGEGAAPAFGGAEVDLFPLTSDGGVVERARRAAGPGAKVLEAGRAVQAEAGALTDRLPGWSAALGRLKIGRTSVRDHFMLSDGKFSAWWFSLLSEKNPLKTDVFLRAAQLQAVDGLLAAGGYQTVMLTLEPGAFSRALAALCRRRGIPCRRRPSRTGGAAGKKALAKRALASLGLLGDVALALLWVWRFAGRRRLVRRALGPLASRPSRPGAVLFTGVFPLLDEARAKEGVFDNRFFAPLQRLCRQRGRPAQWLLLWIPAEGHSFPASVELARAFSQKGEALFFLEDFFTPGAALAALAAWVRQLVLCAFLPRRAPAGFLWEGFSLPESRLLLMPLWRQSFAGNVGMGGLVAYECFKRALAHLSGNLLVHHAEMQGWERALNAAKRSLAPGMTSIGFQHTAVQRRFFPYFIDPSEAADLPLPDVLACSGEGPARLLAGRGYPRVQAVEALRHLHLVPVLARPAPEKRTPPVFIIAGSIDGRETESSLRLALEALEGAPPIDVWFKPHPAMEGGEAVDGLLKGAAVRVRRERMDALLPEAALVMVGNSTLSAEALAYGCRVVVADRCDALVINVLEGREDLYDRVSTAGELRAVIEKVCGGPRPAKAVERGRDFVRDYWRLDESLPRWKELFGV